MQYAFRVAKLLLMIGLLSGCAHFDWGTPSKERRLDRSQFSERLQGYIADEDFRRALSLFDTLSPEEKRGLRTQEGVLLSRSQILSAADESIHRRLKAIDSSVGHHEWQNAFRLLREAKHKLPKHLYHQIESKKRSLYLQYNQYQDDLSIEADMKYGQWITKQLEIDELASFNASSLSRVWLSIKRDYYVHKQNKLATDLLDVADEALLSERYLLVNRIYGTLSNFKLIPDIEKRHLQLGYQLLESADSMVAEISDHKDRADSTRPLERLSTDLVEDMDSWVSHLHSMKQEGRLLEMKKLLGQLREFSLSRSQQTQVDLAQLYLQEQIALLDKRADHLYGKGEIPDAHSIWALLTKLDDGNEEIRVKYNRSLKVLGNMQILRQEGYLREASQ